jgi:hypothetical protein
MSERSGARSSLAKPKPEIGEMILNDLNQSHLTPSRPRIDSRDSYVQDFACETNVTPKRINDVVPEPSEYSPSVGVIPQPSISWKGSDVGRKSSLMRKEREL